MIRLPRFWSSIALLLLSAIPGAGAARASDVRFPDTAPGSHAREWFAANAQGEAAMRAFWTRHGDAASLAERPVDARVDTWRRIHSQMGIATPLAVTTERADFIAVRARDGQGQEILVSFECASAPPHGLLGIRVEPADQAAGGPGGPERGPGGPGGPELPPGPPPSDAEVIAGLALRIDSLSFAGEFSGAALLVKGDSVLYQRACGLASRERREPNTLDTRFNLGSINKIFTQVSIFQLAEAGKVALDSTIDHYLPDYPLEKGSKLTVRQLIEHRGGVPDVFGARYERVGAKNVKTLADWYALIRDEPLRFAPGTRQQYSNGGYVLLGAIIERLSGESYYDYMRRHIYEPAGMTRTEHLMNAASQPSRAMAYTHDENAKAEPTLAELPGRGSPAGGGYSTVGDLVRFAKALRGGKLMQGTFAPNLVGPGAALGIVGGSPGVNGLLMFDGPYVLVVLANTNPPAAERFMDTTGRAIRRAAGDGGAHRTIGGHGGH